MQGRMSIKADTNRVMRDVLNETREGKVVR